MKKIIAILMLCVLTVGCTTNPVSPLGLIVNVGVFWLNGEAHKYYKCSEDTLLDVTRETIYELGMTIEQEESRDNYYYIRALAEEKVFKIKIRRMTKSVSKLSIRVDTFGDKSYVELFYQAVDNKKGINDFRTTQELEATLKRDGLLFKRIRERR